MVFAFRGESGIFWAPNGRAYAVGDEGLVLQIDGGTTPPVSTIPAGVTQNLFGVWVNADPTFDPVQNPGGPGIQIWTVGASGSVTLGRYY